MLDLADEHPFVCASQKGRNAPPPPFEEVAVWAVAQFRSWGGGAPAASVRDWRYVRSEHPAERLLHLTSTAPPYGTRHCFHKGRAHKSQNVMVTIDLLRGDAWQRCWDNECVHHRPCVVAGPRACGDAPRRALGETIRAKYQLPLLPAACIPNHLQLHRFEEECGLLAGTSACAVPGSSTGLVVD